MDQALKNGKGVTWLDDTRIPYVSENDKSGAIPQGRITTRVGSFAGRTQEGTDKELDRESWKDQMKGRFSANLLVSDDTLNDGKVTKSVARSPRVCKHPEGVTYMVDKSTGQEHTDSGSFSRYFDLDRWAKKTFPFLIVPKASKSERDKGLTGDMGLVEALHGNVNGSLNKRTNGNPSIARNRHPTVKPLKLMAYLVTLGSRPNDIVLDPFCGSGTTCIAARNLGRRFLGIELSPEYVNLAENRLGLDQPTLDIV